MTRTTKWEDEQDVEFQNPLLLQEDSSLDDQDTMLETTVTKRHGGGGARSWQPSLLLQCLLWMIQLTLAVVLVVLGVTQWNDCSAIPTLPLWSLTLGLWELVVTTTTILGAGTARRECCGGGGDKEENGCGGDDDDCTSRAEDDEDDVTTTTILMMESVWIGYGAALVLPPLFVSPQSHTPGNDDDSCCASQLYLCSLYVVLSFLGMLAGMAFLRLVRATRRRR